MKKLALITILLLILCSCTVSKGESIPDTTAKDTTVKAVWIFYRELSMVNEQGGTAQSFETKINKIFSDCKSMGLNTVFVQVRPFSDSFYPSDIFPWSEYLTGEQGKSVKYDPLKIMLNCADKYDLSFHAWINPFRISFKTDFSELSAEHPALNFEKNKDVFTSDGGIYFNPASIKAQRIILDGIKEIVRNYNVDGIHIDDYFYPTTDEVIDEEQYNKYKKNGGLLSLYSWRLQNINAFVSGMYQSVKMINPNVIVSVSPAGNINNNYETQYADVELWCSQKGYCDMIIPQLYFGFNHETLPFISTLHQWSELNINSDIKLICGIGAYKAVSPENDEWKSTDIINKQIDVVSASEHYDGYCLFSYSSLTKLEYKHIQ